MLFNTHGLLFVLDGLQADNLFGSLVIAASLAIVPVQSCPAFARNVQRLAISPEPRAYAEQWSRQWPAEAEIIELALQMGTLLHGRQDAGDWAYQACIQATRDVAS